MEPSEHFIRKCLLRKAFSDSTRSGFLVPYQISRFLITFSNSIRSGLSLYCIKVDATITEYYYKPI